MKKIPDSLVAEISRHRPRVGMYFAVRKLKRRFRDVSDCLGQMRSAMNRRNYPEAERYLAAAERVMRGK